MYHYFKGVLAYKDPAIAVIDVQGIGYELRIPLSTFSLLPDIGQPCRLFAHLHVKEDAHTLFGFWGEDEKKMFLLLTSVSGVGPATGLMLLSSLTVEEIKAAIVRSNLRVIQAVKGIGAKTAQRLVLELKDKVGRVDAANPMPMGSQPLSPGLPISANEEIALEALIQLGLPKVTAEKNLKTVQLKNGTGLSVEELIRLALKTP